jgi:hypothetical protein
MGFSKNWAIDLHNEQMQDAEYAARYEADRAEAEYYALQDQRDRSSSSSSSEDYDND